MIPFLDNYTLKGHKANDCKDFNKVFEIMLTKGHLTEEGLANIIKIKNAMNTKRT